jgi:hypothetical protein
MADINMKRGDLAPSVSAVLYSSGAVVDLTGSTVKLIMKNRSTGVEKVNAACVIVTPAAGAVRYDWTGTDTDTAGTYDVEFQVTLPTTKKLTCPNNKHLECLVYPDVGS